MSVDTKLASRVTESKLQSNEGGEGLQNHSELALEIFTGLSFMLFVSHIET